MHTISWMVGVALFLFGIITFFYGILLYGDYLGEYRASAGTQLIPKLLGSLDYPSLSLLFLIYGLITSATGMLIMYLLSGRRNH